VPDTVVDHELEVLGTVLARTNSVGPCFRVNVYAASPSIGLFIRSLTLRTTERTRRRRGEVRLLYIVSIDLAGSRCF